MKKTISLYHPFNYKIKLRFIDVDINFHNKFNHWMLNSTYTKGGDEMHYTKNYIGSIFKSISKFMSASHSKLHDFTGYKDAEFKIPFKQTDSIYLTKNEIQKIYDLDITEELLKKNGYQKKFNPTIYNDIPN